MLIGRFLGVLAAAWALSLPAMAQIKDLVPHRALYKIRPAPVAAGTLPVEASGSVAYEFKHTCDGISPNSRSQISIQSYNGFVR